MDRWDSVSELWPVHPKPAADELLSSWLARLAMAHGLKLHTFTQLTWPGKSIWNRDVDRSADSEVLATLVRRTGASAESVEATTLCAYEGVLFEQYNPTGTTQWIMPLGIYHRTRRSYGLQFCPRCLDEDAEPYYRRAWRLACVSMCVRHEVMLLDRCPDCAAPVIFHRGDLGQRSKRVAESLTDCHVCGLDRRLAAVEDAARWADGLDLLIQHRLARIIREGWMWVSGEGPCYSHLFLRVLRHLSHLLAFGAKAEVLRGEVCRRFGVPNFTVAVQGRQRVIEWLDVRTRRCVLLTAMLLLQDWPHALVEICERNRIWSSVLLGDLKPVPHWYARVVQEYLTRTSYHPTIEEIAWCIAKNQEVFGGRYKPPTQRIRFRSVWNAAGVSVSPYSL